MSKLDTRRLNLIGVAATGLALMYLGPRWVGQSSSWSNNADADFLRFLIITQLMALGGQVVLFFIVWVMPRSPSQRVLQAITVVTAVICAIGLVWIGVTLIDV